MKKSNSKKQSTTAGRKRRDFQIRAKPRSEVCLSGSFNNWDHEAKKQKDTTGDGDYSITIFLPPGRHEYKFVINGEWQVDPECPDWVVNKYGTLNNVIDVGP